MLMKHTILIFALLFCLDANAQVQLKEPYQQFTIRDKSVQFQLLGYQTAAIYYDFLIYKFSNNLRLFSRAGVGFSKDFMDFTYEASAHFGLSYQTDVLPHVFFDVSSLGAYGETVDSKTRQISAFKTVHIGMEGAIRFYIDPKRYYRVGIVPYYNFDVQGKDFFKNSADVGAFIAIGRAF
jgi:hypothetical protein